MLRTIPCVCLLSSIAIAGPAPAPIVGGTTVLPGRWPDVAAVLGREGRCTGTLIAPDVVLTAGHCIGMNPVKVVLGTVDLGETGGDVIDVKWSRAYPDWERRYDVGVLMLEHVARQKPRMIASACTANDRLPIAKTVDVVGFGLTTRSGTGTNTRLHQVALPIADPFCALDPSCERSIMPNGEFTAGGHGGDTCFGDSGGPAYLATPEGPALVGVVSRGLALPGAPCGNGGVYVRADKVVAWIQDVTGRKLHRTTCGGSGDEPGEGDGAGNGCSSGRGGELGGMLMIAVLAGVRRRWRSRYVLTCSW